MTDDLERRLATLEVTVDRLRAEVEQRHARTMRGDLRCPSCDGGVIYHFKHVPDDRGPDAMVKGQLSLAKHYGFFGTEELATLEAFACFGCGLVEWHVTGLGGLTPDGETVTVYRKETPPKTDPYR